MSETAGYNSSDLQLLKSEIEAMGGFLANERLERKAEVDALRLHFEAIRRTLERSTPTFRQLYEQTYAELLQYYDNESARDLKVGPRSATA